MENHANFSLVSYQKRISSRSYFQIFCKHLLRHSLRLLNLCTKSRNEKKTHTIAEELVLPAALDLVSTMIKESVAQKLKAVPLSKFSNNTICRRIDKIWDDNSDQLVAKMRGNEFRLQFDEATTSTSDKDAYLICYVRFIDIDDNIVEDLLFCKPILTNCRAHKLLAILNNFFLENNLEWKYCVGLCTDGVRAMSGRFSRLETLVQCVAVNAKWTHC